MSVIVHASAVAVGRKGVLLLGASGTGKSDLALRLIRDGARLIADDRTRIDLRANTLFASAPPSIAGLIEVRGLGIVTLSVTGARIALAVQLGKEGPRLPQRQSWTPKGLKGAPSIPLIALDGRHASDPAKIVLALEAFANDLFRDTFRPDAD